MAKKRPGRRPQRLKPQRRGLSKEARLTYGVRNRILERLGFQSYKKYLQSKLWKGIRSRQLKLRAHCYACDRPANSVHHEAYTEENLSGESLEMLKSVCRGCHLKIEFTKNGRKRSPMQANRRLLQLRNRNLLQF